MAMITASDCEKISNNPKMDYILDYIKSAADEGKTHTSLCIPVSKKQACKLKELGFIVTWQSHQEYSGGYKVYWGGDDMKKPKGFWKKLDYLITEQVEYHI